MRCRTMFMLNVRAAAGPLCAGRRSRLRLVVAVPVPVTVAAAVMATAFALPMGAAVIDVIAACAVLSAVTPVIVAGRKPALARLARSGRFCGDGIQ